ncbi:MAG TPA: FAD-dependent monooxygenase, partial [Bdellovibrionota bacterium]|nr:FAD-dependent monooxygenase [Bdellovibrionota bacterium]
VLHEVVAVAEEGMRLARRELAALPEEMLVLGGGPIGAMQALIARESGVKPVVIEKREHRVQAVRALGIECVSLAQALVDSRFAGRFDLLADATNDGHGDSGAFRHLPLFANKGFVALIIGKYLRPQEIPLVFNRLGGRLVWMRGMPNSTLRESVAKWNDRIESLARGYLCEVFPSGNANQAFEFAAARKSVLKTVIAL